MQFLRWKNFLIVLVLLVVLASGFYFAFLKSFFFASEKVSTASVSVKTSSADSATEIKTEIKNVELLAKKLENPPEIIKAVFVTGYSAGSKSYINYLNSFLEKTEINAVVIDIKGSDGVATYPRLILNINSLINFLHEKNIYVIGRISVFQDPVFARARPDLAIQNYGLTWMDPASKDVWDYNIALAKDALENHGFDEINFDYVRFPSDGNMENLKYPVWDETIKKADVIKNFFEYLRKNLEGHKISVDLFGQTTTNAGDMGIGQIIENAFLNFDYVCPMLYPSHYAEKFGGFLNPAEHPYEIVKYSLETAAAREKILSEKSNESFGSPAAASEFANFPKELAKLRPWLQDFNIGADYTAEMVKQEILATQDSLKENYTGFMLWNPSNIYTAGAVLKNFY